MKTAVFPFAGQLAWLEIGELISGRTRQRAGSAQAAELGCEGKSESEREEFVCVRNQIKTTAANTQFELPRPGQSKHTNANGGRKRDIISWSAASVMLAL